MKELYLTINTLREYMDHIQNEAYTPKTSVYEYIVNNADKYGIEPTEKFQLVIKDIDFARQENFINLEMANLSGVTFKNINFNSQGIILKRANLIGCRLINSKFTGGISLEGTEFGPIELDRTVFVDADIKNTKYDPTNPNAILFPVTRGILDQYLSTAAPRQNFNQYLNSLFGHIYDNRPLIANLSEITIDQRFSDADISGANLTNARITGEISNLIMRDCKTCNTVFEDCTLTNPDLRGTSLANQGTILSHSFNPVTCGFNVTFDNPKLSLNSNIEKLNGYSINALLFDDLSPETTKGIMIRNATFDPCYDETKPNIIKTPYKCSKADLESYARDTKNIVGNKEDFLSYIKRTKNIKEQNIYADFSGQDLSGVNFSKGKFKNCDFSLCVLNGCNFKDSVVENCNFTRVTSSRSLISSQRPIAYGLGQLVRGLTLGLFSTDIPIEMENATFNNCDFTWADLPYARAKHVNFHNVKAINLNVPGLAIPNSVIADSDVSGACLYYAQANGSSIHRTDCTNGQLQNSNMTECIISSSTLDGASLSDAKMNQSKLLNVSSNNDTKWNRSKHSSSTISGSKIAGQCVGMKNDQTTQYIDSDISSLDIRANHVGDPNLEQAIESDNKYIISHNHEQEMIRANEKSFYNKIGIGLLIGLVVASVAFPPLLGALLPATIAAAAANVISIGAIVVGVSVGMELMIRNFSPIKAAYEKGPSIIRPLSNFFGAKKIINFFNGKHQQRAAENADILQQREHNKERVNAYETKIIEKDRQNRLEKAVEQAKKAKSAKAKTHWRTVRTAVKKPVKNIAK